MKSNKCDLLCGVRSGGRKEGTWCSQEVPWSESSDTLRKGVRESGSSCLGNDQSTVLRKPPCLTLRFCSCILCHISLTIIGHQTNLN